jgi:hypothetical protein
VTAVIREMEATLSSFDASGQITLAHFKETIFANGTMRTRTQQQQGGVDLDDLLTPLVKAAIWIAEKLLLMESIRHICARTLRDPRVMRRE